MPPPPTPRALAQQGPHGRNAVSAKTSTRGNLQTYPKRRSIVLPCTDYHIDVTTAFGGEMSSAHMVRNDGASARAALPRIMAVQFLGAREIVVVKHTRCGMQNFTSDKVSEMIKMRYGVEAAAAIGMLELKFVPWSDLAAAVRDDCEFLSKQSALLPGTTISGWIYDVKTGKVTQIV